MVWAWPLEHFFKVVQSALCGLLATFAVGSGHERVVAPLLLICPFDGTVGGAFVGVLVLPHLCIRAIKDSSNRLLFGGVTGGDVPEFLGSPWTPAS